MHFTTLALLPLLALTTATPLSTRQNGDLERWSMTRLATQNGGRPGNYPWITITATVVDPNEYNLGPPREGAEDVIIPANGTAQNCQSKHISPDSPYGRRWACDNTGGGGYWYMEVVEVPEGGNVLNNFELRFTREIQVISQGVLLQRAYRAQAVFSAATNLRGGCSASGTCGWSLRSENIPFPLAQGLLSGGGPTQEVE